MKNLLDKNYFDRLRGGILSDEDVQLLLEVIGPMLMDTDYVIVEKDELKKYKKEEPKRLWKIDCYNPDLASSCYFGYKSEPRDLTESEAVKWYNEYIPEYGMKKGRLLYKKEGEWVVYETTK